MTGFSRPPGDPDALDRVATRLTSMAETVGNDRAGTLRRDGGTVVTALPPARVADFTTAQGQITKATGAVGLSLATCAGALSGYAEQLRTAQHEVTSAAAAWDQAERAYREAHSAGEETAAQTHRTEMTRQQDRADRATADLSTAETRACAALSGELDVWVPGRGALSGVQAWEAAAQGLVPTGVVLDRDDLEKAYRDVRDDPAVQNVLFTKTLLARSIKGGLKGFQGYQVLQYARSMTIAAGAERKFAAAVEAYQAIKGAAPNLADPAVYKQYMQAEKAALKAFGKLTQSGEVLQAQRLFKMYRSTLGDAGAMAKIRGLYGPLSDAEIIGKIGKLEPLIGPFRPAMPILSKAAGPLGIATGAYDVYSALTDSDLDTDDRVARGVGGTASIIGGAGTMMMVAGALGPVGVGVVAAAGVVAVGCWAYENREAIANGAKKVGGAIAGGAKKVWKGLFG